MSVSYVLYLTTYKHTSRYLLDLPTTQSIKKEFHFPFPSMLPYYILCKSQECNAIYLCRSNACFPLHVIPCYAMPYSKASYVVHTTTPHHTTIIHSLSSFIYASLRIRSEYISPPYGAYPHRILPSPHLPGHQREVSHVTP